MVVNQYFPSQVILHMGKFEVVFSFLLGMKHQLSLAPVFREMDKMVGACYDRNRWWLAHTRIKSDSMRKQKQ